MFLVKSILSIFFSQGKLLLKVKRFFPVHKLKKKEKRKKKSLKFSILQRESVKLSCSWARVINFGKDKHPQYSHLESLIRVSFFFYFSLFRSSNYKENTTLHYYTTKLASTNLFNSGFSCMVLSLLTSHHLVLYFVILHVI